MLKEMGVYVSGRAAKSRGAILLKLGRESIRLSQVQDIAGCRVVVGSVGEQDVFVGELRKRFEITTMKDRRKSPQFGYRAVHIIPKVSGKAIEIQVRTTLQHHWAALSEKCYDVVDKEIKFGGGPKEWQEILNSLSKSIEIFEDVESEFPISVGGPRSVLLIKMRRGIFQQIRSVEQEIMAFEVRKDNPS